MKSKRSAPGILFLFWSLVFIALAFRSYSQDELAQASIHQENCILKLPKACLQRSINDTVLPTLGNSGKGLVHCEFILLQTDGTDDRSVMKDGKEPAVLLYNSYSEEELKILQEQQRLMEEQFLIEWQNQMRKDKMDLQLGEIIKSFYMQSPY